MNGARCALVPLLVLSLGGFVARGAATGFATPVQHVVLIVQENHSFDNVLGFWCSQSGRCAGATVGDLSGGTPISLTKATNFVPDVAHDSVAQVTAMDSGRMDGFSLLKGCHASDGYRCFTQYQPGEIPNVSSLAANFVVADHTFEDGPIASWGLHLEAITTNLDGFSGGTPVHGTKGSLGPGWGCDSGNDDGWTSPAGVKEMVPACVPDYTLDPSRYPYGGAYRPTPVQHVPTILDEMNGAGISWRIYAGLGGNGNSNGYGWSICPSFAECIYKQSQHLVANTQVLSDAADGALPNFSIVTPSLGNSQHNARLMAHGDNWVGSVVSAIENGPDWSSTAIFITWDDCGGFYDHVAPPAGYGVRVPMIIVSPYAVRGHTDSNTASDASMLAFVEHDFGLSPLSSLDGQAYAFSGSFNFTQAPLGPVRMVTTRSSAADEARAAATQPDPADPT
jgi:phospholipase C